MLLIDKIEDLKDELSQLQVQEKELVDGIIESKLTNDWNKKDTCITAQITRAMAYLENKPNIYCNVIRKTKFNYQTNKFEYSDSGIYDINTYRLEQKYNYRGCKFKDIRKLVDWESAFKDYINDYPKIWSLEKWKRSLSLDDVWKIVLKQYENEVYLINHSKIKVKNIVIIRERIHY